MSLGRVAQRLSRCGAVVSRKWGTMHVLYHITYCLSVYFSLPLTLLLTVTLIEGNFLVKARFDATWRYHCWGWLSWISSCKWASSSGSSCPSTSLDVSIKKLARTNVCIDFREIRVCSRHWSGDIGDTQWVENFEEMGFVGPFILKYVEGILTYLLNYRI